MGTTRGIYISAGSNLGDRKGNLSEGLQLLRLAGVRPISVSSFFETEPVENRNQPWFLNMALEVETVLPPQDLLHCCLEIEFVRGRVRSSRGAPRTLDLDILLYGDMVVQESHLTIPHPRMAVRRFVLEPLAEIAPQVIHPVLQRSVVSLLQTCPDHSCVQRYSSGGSP
jgi:2-amino-4-hydroxy-6-hydroxymethyldihydropteridine diphosphokinase